MVETSIVLSIFFILVLGMIEMSQTGMVSQLLTSAANTGCRTAIISGYSQTDVTNAVSTVLASGGIPSASYTLTTTPSDVTLTHLGDSITVSIRVPFRNISWLGTPMFLGSATVSSSATMTSERP